MTRRLIDDTYTLSREEVCRMVWDRFATLREAGEALGMDRTQVCKLTNGHRPITPQTSDVIRARLDRYDTRQRRREAGRRNRRGEG